MRSLRPFGARCSGAACNKLLCSLSQDYQERLVTRRFQGKARASICYRPDELKEDRPRTGRYRDQGQSGDTRGDQIGVTNCPIKGLPECTIRGHQGRPAREGH